MQGNEVEDADGVICEDVLKLLWDRWKSLQKFQSTPFKLETDPKVIAYCQSLHFIDNEEVLYQMSLNTQPSIFFTVYTCVK